MGRVELELRSLKSVIPYEGNPRINGAAVDAVAASIGKFGFQNPILVDEAGVIVAGHTRYLAATKLGLAEVPVRVVRGLSPDLLRAYRIADNQTAMLSSWDKDKLVVELMELQRVDFDLTLTGFTPDDLLRYMGSEVADGLTDPDYVPELPDEPFCRTGDLWILGPHRLLIGDSSDPAAVDRVLGHDPIHLVNTDPPYNVAATSRSKSAIAAGLSSVDRGKSSGKPGKLRAKDRPLANDSVSEEEYARLLRAWFGNLSRVLLPGRSFYIWAGYANLATYPAPLRESGLYFSQAIVWDKRHPVMTRKDFMGCFELAFYGWKEGAAHQYFGPNNALDLWHVKKVNPQKMVHLCLHPDALVLTDAGYRPIRDLSVGNRVFAGDGRFRRVKHVSSHPYTSECLYRISARGGSATTDASDNHPFLIWRPVKKGAKIIGGEVSWLRADQIRRGDYTLTPVPAEPESDPFPEWSEDDWFLFGLYLAQGHLQRAGHGANRYPAFSLHKRRQDLVDRIIARWPGAKEYDPNDYASEPSSGLTVMAFDPEAGRRFEELGGRLAHAKRLDARCLALPRAKRSALFHGWLNGDGCKVHDRSYWQGNTVSADLAAHLSLLAESVGFRANTFTLDPPKDLGGIGGRRFKSRRRVYNLYFYEKGQQNRRGSPLRMEHEGRQYELRYVKKVERVPYQGDVWNLSVEGHPSFQTAVGLSHNTEKPVELAEQAIQYSSRPGENVLDLFGGSGSTLIAAERTGRRAFLIELDRHYGAQIISRWQAFTGKQAIHADTGKPFPLPPEIASAVPNEEPPSFESPDGSDRPTLMP